MTIFDLSPLEMLACGVFCALFLWAIVHTLTRKGGGQR